MSLIVSNVTQTNFIVSFDRVNVSFISALTVISVLGWSVISQNCACNDVTRVRRYNFNDKNRNLKFKLRMLRLESATERSTVNYKNC